MTRFYRNPLLAGEEKNQTSSATMLAIHNFRKSVEDQNMVPLYYKGVFVGKNRVNTPGAVFPNSDAVKSKLPEAALMVRLALSDSISGLPSSVKVPWRSTSTSSPVHTAHVQACPRENQRVSRAAPSVRI